MTIQSTGPLITVQSKPLTLIGLIFAASVSLAGCQSDSASNNTSPSGGADYIETTEKTQIQISAPANGVAYWLSADSVPVGWIAPEGEQSSPTFALKTGATDVEMSVFLQLNQRSTTNQISGSQVLVKVVPIEEAPIAMGESFSIIKGQTVTHPELSQADTANLLLNDRDEPEHSSPSDRLKIELIEAPKHAESFDLGQRGGWVYGTSTSTTAQLDSFSYRVKDGLFTSDVATVEIRLVSADANSPPVAANTCHSVPQPELGYRGNLSTLVQDAEDQVFSFKAVQLPQHGTLQLDISAGTFLYTPTTSERGYLDSFRYEVDDLRGGKTEATFSMIVGQRRIMPIGDSITWGVESTSGASGDQPTEAFAIGFRQELKSLLQADGYNIDFVGPKRSGYATLEDAEHAGFSGWKAGDLALGHPIQKVAGSVTQWLDAHPADIVLVHAGTNDHGPDATVLTPLLDKIQEWSSSNARNLELYVASIVDQRRDRTDRAYLDAFNAGVESLALSQPSTVFVNQYNSLDWRTDITDYDTGVTGLHPNALGYKKIAQTWFDALTQNNSLHKCP